MAPGPESQAITLDQFGTSGEASKWVKLVPASLGIKSEVDELKHQREICGWGAENIPQWAEECFQLKKIIYWITLPEFVSKLKLDPSKACRTIRATYHEDDGGMKHANEKVATFGLPKGKDGIREKYVLTGHISLSLPSPDLGHPADGSILEINNFFIDPRWRAFNLGSTVMDKLEKIAELDPFSHSLPPSTDLELLAVRPKFFNTTRPCHSIIGDTPNRKYWDGSEADRSMWKHVGAKTPERGTSPEEWFLRRGYKIYREPAVRYLVPTKDGTVIQGVTTFLMKEVGVKNSQAKL